MAFRHPIPSAFLAALLPLLAACTQTAAPAAPVASAAPVGEADPEESGILAAINDARRTQARHRLTSTLANHAAGFDPTGLSGWGISAMEEAQERIEEEKQRRIDAELDKALAQGEAYRAQRDADERRKASAKPPRPKTAP